MSDVSRSATGGSEEKDMTDSKLSLSLLPVPQIAFVQPWDDKNNFPVDFSNIKSQKNNIASSF